MKNNTSTSGNVGVQVVAAILSVIAIILGIVAIQAGNASKANLKDIRTGLDNETAHVDKVENDLRQLRMQTQAAVTEMATRMDALRDQMTKPKVEEVKKDDGKKGDGKKEDVAPAGPGTFHAIKSGDSFGKLAKEYGTTAAAIEKLNPNVSSKNLKIGQKIRVK